MAVSMLVNTELLLRAIVQMLLHSLWMGVLLAAAIVLIKLLVPPRRAALRYQLGLLLFTLFVASCAYVLVAACFIKAEQASSLLGEGQSVVLLSATGYFQWVCSGLCNWCMLHAAPLTLLWFACMLFRLIMLATGLSYNHRICNQDISAPGKSWQLLLEKLCSDLQIRKEVQVLQSLRVQVPVVIGHLKPIILIPAGWLLALPPVQAEAILLHELAHIRRHDYLVNICQHMVEALFFYHPAVLAVSSWLREEREHCCDAIATAHAGDPAPLISALINCKEMMLGPGRLQIAFVQGKQPLLRRVQLMAGIPGLRASWREKMLVAASVVLILLLLTANRTGPVEMRTSTTTKPAIKSASPKTDITVNPSRSNSMTAALRPSRKAHNKKASLKSAPYSSVAQNREAQGGSHEITIHGPLAAIIAQSKSEIVELPMTAKTASDQQAQSIADQQRAAKQQQLARQQQQLALQEQKLAAEAMLTAQLQQIVAETDRQKAVIDQQTARKNKLLAEQALLAQLQH